MLKRKQTKIDNKLTYKEIKSYKWGIIIKMKNDVSLVH